MIPASATTSSPFLPLAPRRRQLEALVGVAVQMAGEQYQALATRLACALIDATDGDSRAAQHHRRAGNLLSHRRVAFIRLAAEALDKALRREVAALSTMCESGRGERGQSRVMAPAEDGDDSAAIAGIIRPFDRLHSDALQTLNVRLAFLLDRGILRVSENPFRPEVFVSALQQAWMAFSPGPEATPLLLPLIKPGIFIEFGPVFNALNLALQTQGRPSGPVAGHQGRRSDAASTGPHDPPFEAMRRGAPALTT